MPETIAALDPQPVGPLVRNPLRWLVFAVVIAADMMDLMDATIVNVAAPDSGRSRRHRLHPAGLSAGYTLAFAVFLITGARLGDMFGRRRLFLIGSAGFTVMSAACAPPHHRRHLSASGWCRACSAR